jgi:hypothetical protein
VELSLEFIDLHFLADLHIAISPPHAPIEHFIEVNVSVIALDSHFENLLLELHVVKLMLWEAQIWVFFA